MPLSYEQAERVRKKARARVEYAKKVKGKRTPILYVPDGTLTGRFYTDRAGQDCRTFYRHKRGRFAIHCLGPDRCAVCRRLELMDQRLRDAHHFRRREITIAYFIPLVYEGPESLFVELHQPLLLMGNYRLANGLAEIISDLGIKGQIQKFFDPNAFYPQVKIVSKERGRGLSMGLMPSLQVKVEPLPNDFPPLSEQIFLEDEEPSPADTRRFIALMEEAHEQALMAKAETRSATRAARP